MENIVIIGGGAGGLALATQLGKKFKRSKKTQIILIDKNPSHIWKPLLHEVAAGSLDSSFDELNYRYHGKKNHFNFVLGSLETIDCKNQQLILAERYDDNGELITPVQTLAYTYVVIAIGGISNDFDVSGAKENCYFLDDKAQAERFHQHLLNQTDRLRCTALNTFNDKPTLHIGIVGGGATGVELAAELQHTALSLSGYQHNDSENVNYHITLVEAGPRILPALSEKLSKAAQRTLEKIGIEVRCDTGVKECTEQGFITNSDEVIECDIRVWATGIKAPPLLTSITGLESNSRNQLAVLNTLQSTTDEHVFVIGDCASCPLPNGGFVPPRAQAAHQMASLVYKNILRSRRNKSLKPFRYRDFGSLVSLSNYNTVGGLMSGSIGSEMRIGGPIARLVYLSLYRMHLLAVHGLYHSLLIALAGRIHRAIKPKLKLH
ncbi:NADH dehydrogenase [Zhongshania aliphaticivorans]|uniref:NADH dehydrogenase n=1 Tax=Zhongshania aliphaticivorans TaxID=1470434 RepID=A0A5S9N7M5_9GAMM|nr:NAD(P)/FAD-dependent oxidoreductase [Zhongshania aliphaticivorans]CAA0080573.1 NADH dehydrogenase [Zhongshania aliphaticivorans]CAA0085560.1 NADH dehydrogenase [Zhongshania aliphaticivorans]